MKFEDENHRIQPFLTQKTVLIFFVLSVASALPLYFVNDFDKKLLFSGTIKTNSYKQMKSMRFYHSDLSKTAIHYNINFLATVGIFNPTNYSQSYCYDEKCDELITRKMTAEPGSRFSNALFTKTFHAFDAPQVSELQVYGYLDFITGFAVEVNLPSSMLVISSIVLRLASVVLMIALFFLVKQEVPKSLYLFIALALYQKPFLLFQFITHSKLLLFISTIFTSTFPFILISYVIHISDPESPIAKTFSGSVAFSWFWTYLFQELGKQSLLHFGLIATILIIIFFTYKAKTEILTAIKTKPYFTFNLLIGPILLFLPFFEPLKPFAVSATEHILSFSICIVWVSQLLVNTGRLITNKQEETPIAQEADGSDNFDFAAPSEPQKEESDIFAIAGKEPLDLSGFSAPPKTTNGFDSKESQKAKNVFDSLPPETNYNTTNVFESFSEPRQTTEQKSTNIFESFNEQKQTTEQKSTNVFESLDTVEQESTNVFDSLNESKQTTESTNVFESFNEQKQTTEQKSTNVFESFNESKQTTESTNVFDSFNESKQTTESTNVFESFNEQKQTNEQKSTEGQTEFDKPNQNERNLFDSFDKSTPTQQKQVSVFESFSKPKRTNAFDDSSSAEPNNSSLPKEIEKSQETNIFDSFSSPSKSAPEHDLFGSFDQSTNIFDKTPLSSTEPSIFSTISTTPDDFGVPESKPDTAEPDVFNSFGGDVFFGSPHKTKKPSVLSMLKRKESIPSPVAEPETPLVEEPLFGGFDDFSTSTAPKESLFGSFSTKESSKSNFDLFM